MASSANETTMEYMTTAPSEWNCKSLVSLSASELRAKLAGSYTFVVFKALRFSFTKEVLCTVAGPATLATMSIPPILLAIMIIMYILEMRFFFYQAIHWRKKAYYVWILGTFPVCTLK